MDSSVLYREVQNFGSPLLTGTLLVVSAAMFGFWGFAIFRVVFKKEALGNLSPVLTLSLGVPLTVLAISLALLFITLKMTTEVRSDGLYVQLFPLHLSFRQIDLDGLEDYEIRTYRPIREYGGWGIRSGANGLAYNLGGNQGLQLKFANERPVLIGTADPSGLLDAFDGMVKARQ